MMVLRRPIRAGAHRFVLCNRMRFALGTLLLACVAAASCDRRPEEPLLERTPASELNPPAKPASTQSDGRYETKTLTNRCTVPLPSEPPPKPEPAKNCPPDPISGGMPLKTAKLSFPEAASAPEVVVELALDPEERQRGLMYRTHMAENAGMLFDFPGPQRVQSFWMRNTCIPLDMLFIDGDGYIAGIQENVPTLNDASRSIPCPVRYVLELNAGWARDHGVRPGQRVKLPPRE